MMIKAVVNKHAVVCRVVCPVLEISFCWVVFFLLDIFLLEMATDNK